MGEKLVSCCCTQFPDEIGAGLTFDVLLTLTAYPAPEWAISVHLRGLQPIDLQAVPEGSQHRIHADAETTKTWVPGSYWYSMRATRGAEVVEVESGSVTVKPDVMSAGEGFDGRSQAEIALDAINAVLAKRATLDQERYRINNRELYRTSIPDLLRLRSFYIEEVRRERARACGRNPFGAVVRVRLQ